VQLCEELSPEPSGELCRERREKRCPKLWAKHGVERCGTLSPTLWNELSGELFEERCNEPCEELSEEL